MDDYKRGYSRGYNAGISNRWPEYKPPTPPDEIVAELIHVSRILRDRYDYLCATFSEEDQAVREISPAIEEFDALMVKISKWLRANQLSAAAPPACVERLTP